MSEAQNTNVIDSVTFSRNENDHLVISITAVLSPESLLTGYYQYMESQGSRPAEILWNEITNTMDIGASELKVPDDFYPGFDIVADETLSGEALDSALFEEEKLEADRANAVTSENQTNEEQTPNTRDARGLTTPSNAASVTPIRNNNNVTKIKSNTGPTKISSASPTQLADSRVIERLVKEGIGARAKPQQRQQKPRREAAPLPVVHHTERGSELLAKAMSGFRENGTDGVDFINTSGIALTKLGKMLDINAHVRFHMIDAGEFASVGAFWYFIASESPDESVRNLYGTGCRNARHRLTSRKVEGFNRLIAEATWAKVCSNQELRSYMIGNDLKYNCFFVQEGSTYPIRSNLEEWYMPILEEIGYTLKQIHKSGNEALTPDFSFLDRSYGRNQNQNQRNRY